MQIYNIIIRYYERYELQNRVRVKRPIRGIVVSHVRMCNGNGYGCIQQASSINSETNIII